MVGHILQAVGGLGVFLLGMLVMTTGLRGLAGEAVHVWLNRFTKSPATGALTGTVVTAMLQSSSATVVATVGFVAAGLLSFPQALGVVLGANVGTTITGWLIALLGFKLELGLLAMPLVLLGTLGRIFGKGLVHELGTSIAGFGLLFIGIDFMQAGMGGFQDVVNPDSFPPDTLLGRLGMVGIGLLITVVTQSSSAGVAIAITALAMGALEFGQAASMVVGMDVGTTVTAVIATIGSSDAARRTGYSHTIYNVFTAVLALCLLAPYTWVAGSWAPGWIERSPELALVGFHTTFNLAALVFALPLTTPFARLVERLVPERDAGFARRLDRRLLADARAAEVTLAATLRDQAQFLLRSTELRLTTGAMPESPTAEELGRDLLATRDFIDAMTRASSSPRERSLRTIRSAIHTLDHLRRMLRRLQQEDRIQAILEDDGCAEEAGRLRDLCHRLQQTLPAEIPATLEADCHRLYETLDAQAEDRRARLIAEATNQELGVARAGQLLDAHRWIAVMSRHVWRVAAHVGGFEGDNGELDDGDL